jgi:hypothetical protein
MLDSFYFERRVLSFNSSSSWKHSSQDWSWSPLPYYTGLHRLRGKNKLIDAHGLVLNTDAGIMAKYPFKRTTVEFSGIKILAKGHFIFLLCRGRAWVPDNPRSSAKLFTPAVQNGYAGGQPNCRLYVIRKIIIYWSGTENVGSTQLLENRKSIFPQFQTRVERKKVN